MAGHSGLFKGKIMAFLVRITGYSKDTGKESFKMEPPWWPASELKYDPRFRSSESDGYLNYRAEMSSGEALVIHRQFEPRASQGSFGFPDWQKIIRPMMDELNAVLGPRSQEFSRFVVEVLEWESGF
jgi:hypothetical protein